MTSSDDPMTDDDAAPTLDPEALAALQELAAQDPDGIATLVRQFVQDAQAGLDALRVSGHDADHAAVTLTAHRLKGSCAMFAAAGMASSCAAVERHPFGVLDALPCLKDELARVAAVLEARFGP